MATADSNATAKIVRSKAFAGAMAKVDHRALLTKDQILLVAGTAVAAVLWVVGFLNAVGVMNIEVRAGEGAGINPALDFMVFGLIAILAPYGFIASAETRRVKKIEDRLPDFLRDVAEAGRFGMTLPDAIIVASRGRYGLLTEEIKRMASQLEWGVPVMTALRLFEERVPTPLVQRVVSIVTRANEAGGNVADVLSMVAHDTREVQLSLQERQISMLTYVTVIYISFFVFLVTIYIMAAVFLPQMVLAGEGSRRAPSAPRPSIYRSTTSPSCSSPSWWPSSSTRSGTASWRASCSTAASRTGCSTRRSCSWSAGPSCGSWSRC